MRGKEGKRRGSRDGGKGTKVKTMEERQKQDKEVHSV